MYAVYKDLLSYSAMLEVGSVPFSKSWPKPNYEKLLESGMDSWRVDAIRALREVVEQIPRRKVYKRTFQCTCAVFREFALRVVDGEYDNLQDLYDSLIKHEDYRRFSDCFDKFFEIAKLYAEFGHSQDIPQFSIVHYFKFYPYGYTGDTLNNVYVAVLKDVPYKEKYAAWSPSEEETFSLFADALRKRFKEQEGTVKSSVHTKKDNKDNYHIYWFAEINSPENREYYICRKIGKNLIKVKGPFSDVHSAMDYQQNHFDEIEDSFAAMKNFPSERGESNQERVGEIRREGNVSPDNFTKAFGFRGVEFGNYVEGPRRQKDLNDAYDALMDLSKVTGLPPRALSLGGKLGLAFGARGRGGKNPALAHYESMKTVINLTKKRGAGSLGHEWFHALDNMLAREHEKGVSAFFTESHCGVSHVELSRAMSELCEVINSKTGLTDRSTMLDKYRTKPYWGTTPEYMARAFESYLKSKLKQEGIRNDYLVNVLDEDVWKSRTSAPYAYPTKEELEVIQPCFDNLFSNIQQRAEDENIVLYSASADIEVKSLESKIIPCDKLWPEELGLLAFGEQVLGIQTAFYNGDPRLHGHFDTSTSTIYLNRSSECDLPWVFAHEAFHAMKEDDPVLYQDIMKLAGGEEAFSTEKMDAYRKDRQNPNMSDDLVRQEMLADTFADIATRRRYIVSMAEKKPNTIRRVVNYLTRAIEKFRSVFLGSERASTEDKYPNVRIPSDQYQKLYSGIESLQKELMQRQHLTKGQNMFLSMLADAPRFDGKIHSPYAYSPDKQFKFDCMAFEAMTELHPEIPREKIAAAVASFSPAGKLRYEDRLMASDRGRGFER